MGMHGNVYPHFAVQKDKSIKTPFILRKNTIDLIDMVYGFIILFV